MQQTEIVKRLTERLGPEAEAQGFELVAIEQAGGRGAPLLRVLLDREGGVDLDAIASTNGWVTQLIDEVDPFQCPYTLEISSPGIDRPLVKRDDFSRFAGEEVSLKTQGLKRSSWTGLLDGLKGDDVALKVDGEQVLVPYDNIVKARLKGVVDFGKGREQS